MELQYKGLWLFGLSGSGKTFASQSISYTIDNSFIIDGDDVRELISYDLDYDLDSRLLQLKRIFGITKIALKNNYFPIISSVYMSKELEIELKNNNIITIYLTTYSHWVVAWFIGSGALGSIFGSPSFVPSYTGM